MPTDRSNYINQLLEMWSRLQWPQRLTIIFFGLLGVALIGSVVYFMSRVEYQVFYRDLSYEDAQAIASKLEEQKKDYIVDGTSILVAAPREEIDKLRLEIAGSGLAQSGRIGYEIFDKSQFGLTDFTEQVNLQRALEGELSRTISSLSEIVNTRVHIVLPKDSVFEDKKEKAKASVVVTLKWVVAGAVPGLHTSNVSIVDDELRLLSQSVESGDAARAEMEAGIREQLEREMSGKVVSILEPLVGKGKVHANASIDLDFNTTEQTEETFNPNPQVILSQQRTEERSGGGTSVSGVPGTTSNLGEAPAGATAVPERIRQSEVTNYEVNKVVRHTIQPKGTIQRLSVAVILDHETVYTKSKDGKVVSKSKPRSQKDLDAYRDLVLAAVGFNEARGDRVTIENVPFYTENKPEEEAPATPWYYKWQSYLLPGMKYGAFLVLFLLVYLVLFRPIRQRVFHAISLASLGPGESREVALPAEKDAKALSAGTGLEEIAAGEAGTADSLPEGESGAQDSTPALEAVSDEQIERELIKEASSIQKDSRKYAAMKKKLIDKAKKDPEMVSQLIRTLLRERA
jgi:flagellar M-ring protein FliF